jgi:drug/metabolite transporter (DMT)-like permease
MAGFSVVWNIVLSPYILKEKLSIHDLKGTATILIGCILVGLSGSHDAPEHHSEDIFQLFTGTAFIRYFFIAVTSGLMVCIYIHGSTE